MAEEAAQTAAMLAYEEALRAAQLAEQGQPQPYNGYACGPLVVPGVAATEASVGLDQSGLVAERTGGMMLMESLPVNNFVGQPPPQPQEQQQQQPVDMLQELMGLPGTNLDEAATAQQLLQVLELQRHQQQQQATLTAAVAAEEALQMRPEKHYLTISQDGKL